MKPTPTSRDLPSKDEVEQWARSDLERHDRYIENAVREAAAKIPLNEVVIGIELTADEIKIKTVRYL